MQGQSVATPMKPFVRPRVDISTVGIAERCCAVGASTNPLTLTEKENLGAVEAATEVQEELRHYEHKYDSRTTGKHQAK